MNTTMEATGIAIGTKYFGPAEVLELSGVGDTARVLLVEASDQSEVWAIVALASPACLRPGDRVLVLGEEAERMFIIGCLAQPRPTPSVHCIPLANGAYALAAGQPPYDRLQVHVPDDGLVFEFNAQTRKTRVSVQSGDLEFTARHGDICFRTSQAIRFEGDAVELHGQASLQLKTGARPGDATPSLSLRPSGAELAAPSLNVTARRGDLRFDEAAARGRSWEGQFEQVKLTAHRIETVAEDMITRVKNLYQKIEKLAQLQTERFRVFIRSTWQLKAKNAYLDAEKEFKIDGEQINLG